MPHLMSSENPNGHKLEVLAAELIEELKAKNARLGGDERNEALDAIRNNSDIMAYLARVVKLQEATLANFARLGPDQGPKGKPRVGKGSDGYPE